VSRTKFIGSLEKEVSAYFKKETESPFEKFKATK
jgi:hypothetical protein